MHGINFKDGDMMKLFELEKINLKNKKIRRVKILDLTFLQYEKNKDCKNVVKIFPSNKTEINRDKVFFYLKVNSYSFYTIKALQHWIDIIHYFNGDFIIICDKEKLKRYILKNVKFYNDNIKFIKSIKKPLTKMVKEIVTGFWTNAAYAHLTTFFHSQQNGIKSFWNIDADDTIIAAPPYEVVQLLQKAEKYAAENDISLFSYDMWRSRTRSKAWTFGVTYTRNINQLIDKFKTANRKWQKEYKNCDQALNIDWFCTYLKDNNLAKIETFYTENCYFLHMGDFLFDPVGKFISCFKNNVVNFPLLYALYDNLEMGQIPIARDSISIDSNISEESSVKFLNSLLVYDEKYPKLLAKLWRINIGGNDEIKK